MWGDSESLMAEVYPDVPLRNKPVGREALLSIERARELLGYEPQHHWQEELASGADGATRTS